ncbi:MAG: hypothetical protein EOP83_01100 [Verrucomicrobiaceae bacterium]|nr:MAG: hypothetical protein EOP83_01100 [Verrucomicrobiaceae bacterium]
MGAPDIVSYAFRDDLSRKQIIKLARQYDGVDMAASIGADEDNFPFVIEGENSSVCFWNAYSGIMTWPDEDPVLRYAAAQYLREKAYPVFKSVEEVKRYAKEHDWPRKSL